jgi:hypothetical protein
MNATREATARRALAAMAELARDKARPPTREQVDGGFLAVRRRLDVGRAGWSASPFGRGIPRWSLVASLVAAAMLVVVSVVRFEGPRAPSTMPGLTYLVEGGNVAEGGYLRESGRGGIKVFFTDGTEFILVPGTRGRLGTVDASGARIAIEHGSASFHVTPSRDRRFQIDVGPFLVTVKGTVFAVSWDATVEKFELKLRHGRVTVSGPLSGGEIELRTGQRLLVDLPRGETVIRDQLPEEWLEPENRGVPPAVGPSAEPPAARIGGLLGGAGMAGAVPAPAKLDGERRWAAALAAGDLDRILAEAESTGVRATLEKASSEDLLALADAARYRRRVSLAREALVAVRERFPHSSRSLDAAFLLGRVEETTGGGLARAVEWYDEYLTRAPAGTYASEALGRKMTLSHRLEGPGSARVIAEEYLRRFPTGSYAGAARALLRAP